MKKKITIISLLGILAIALIASDHVDSPSVMGDTADIADFYAFRGENTDNIVFIATVQGILSPANSEDAQFDQNVVLQINIDTNSDEVEDIVIQAVRRGDNMWFFGPEKPLQTGREISILTNANIKESVRITPYQESQITRTTTNGISYFAGATDDPFFFDIAQFRRLKAGTATEFNNPGNDTWNGLNVLSIAVEVPKLLIGDFDTINAWVTTHRKQ